MKVVQNSTNEKHSEREKLQAAYALNMCTVSVSQIVDYHDAYIMEQEYEAILNNLNLKQMPKDEALLKILSEILNTITFFRIQEIKKEQLQNKYERRMKNAIWSAVPSLSVVVSGNPVAIALALVTQIGSGYMNYRKEKANARADKEDAEIELEITAIEQLNSLRRELFTTAWRLASEYDFTDEWRLTEKQIKQYNEILMDQDCVRKYERLDSIKDNFSAYPPFWYFIGNTANMIALDRTLDLSAEARQEYRRIALSHFEKYEDISENNILREDQLAASCALEHVELLISSGSYDKDKVLNLVSKAVKMSGNTYDILEVCAITYLKLNALKEAAGLLKILVNEDYNRVVNGQLLSSIYVRNSQRVEYELLKTRVAPQYLFPMPLNDEKNIDVLQKMFEEQQKSILKAKYREVLKRVVDKYSSEFYRVISVFDVNDNYGGDFFDNSKRAKKVRMINLKNTFLDEEKKNYYIERMQTVSLPLEYVQILEKMYEALFENADFNDPVLQGEVLDRTNNAIVIYRDTINSIQDSLANRSFTVREYEILQRIGIYLFVKDAFNALYQQCCKKIEKSEIQDLFAVEGNLMTLCDKINIPKPEISINGGEYSDDGEPRDLFDVSLFGSQAVIAKSNADYIKGMTSFIKDKMNNISVGEELEVFYRDDAVFERYFNDAIFEKYPSLKPHSIMVIKDSSKEQFDLIFTTEGIVTVIKSKVRKKIPYEDVIYSKNALELFGKRYKKQNVNAGALYQIIKGIDKKFINDLEQKIEYISGTVTANELNKWFKDNIAAVSEDEDIVRAYAWPRMELLNHMGYYMEKDLDKDLYLLQFSYNKQTDEIMQLRIIEYDNLASDFRSKLDNAGGIIKIEGGR